MQVFILIMQIFGLLMQVLTPVFRCYAKNYPERLTNTIFGTSRNFHQNIDLFNIIIYICEYHLYFYVK